MTTAVQIAGENGQLTIAVDNNLTHLTTYIMHAVFLYRTALELVKALARSAHIYIKYSYINIGIFFADIHCMLGIIHTADFAAIALSAAAHITRADAGNDDNLFRLLARRRTYKMTFSRPRRIRQALQLQRGDNVLAGAVAILTKLVKRHRFEACCQYDSTIFFCNQLVLLRIINCTGRADLRADTAFACLELDAGLTVDNRNLRNGLRKGNINRTAILQAHIELARSFAGRTFFRADTAAAAHVSLHAACLFANCHVKIAHEAAHAVHLAIGIERDIFMISRIHHLRRQNAG